MVGDNNLGPEGLQERNLIFVGYSAIYGNQKKIPRKRCTLPLPEPLNIEPVTFREAIGNMPEDLRSVFSQKINEKGCSGRPIDIVVAPDQNGFLLCYVFYDEIGGLRQVGHYIRKRQIVKMRKKKEGELLIVNETTFF